MRFVVVSRTSLYWGYISAPAIRQVFSRGTRCWVLGFLIWSIIFWGGRILSRFEKSWYWVFIKPEYTARPIPMIWAEAVVSGLRKLGWMRRTTKNNGSEKKAEEMAILRPWCFLSFNTGRSSKNQVFSDGYVQADLKHERFTYKFVKRHPDDQSNDRPSRVFMLTMGFQLWNLIS